MKTKGSSFDTTVTSIGQSSPRGASLPVVLQVSAHTDTPKNPAGCSGVFQWEANIPLTSPEEQVASPIRLNESKNKRRGRIASSVIPFFL